jgi:hypothetical protein
VSIPTPQKDIYCVVNYAGELATRASSGRWSFKTLKHALQRRDSDRAYWGVPEASESRVAKYVFAGWAD